jgi:hypothetical protein
MHRRTSSREEDDEGVRIEPGPHSPRTRVNSVPSVPPAQERGPISPSRSLTFSAGGHSRTRSVSGPYTPPLPSPLAFSFSDRQLQERSADEGPLPAAPKHHTRHSRIHSRNLSIFFPRPGALPQATISEDGSQEIEVKVDEEAPAEPIPSANSFHATTPLGAGFTFGGSRSSQRQGPLPTPPPMTSANSSSSASRRGHHHKHSLSHNFFSFLEPGKDLTSPSTLQALHTQPIVTPISPWTPISPMSDPVVPVPPGSTPSPSDGLKNQTPHDIHIPVKAIIFSLLQFLFGAWLWVAGQQIGSLGCTGLGYWVVFDSLGVGIGDVLPWWLSSDSVSAASTRLRRPYG